MAENKPLLTRFLERREIAPRPFKALLYALVLMDLRAQHYGQSTGVKPTDILPPLYWIVGQYLTISCLLSAALFARVDVWFFSFVGLATSMVLVLSALVVELDEAILHPADRDVIAHRPLHPRTYAAARMANFFLFVALMSVSLTIFPAIVGAGLKDAGPWYIPAYVFASLVGNTCIASAVLVVHTAVPGRDLELLRTALAWLQIVLIVVIFYGGQLMLRNATGGLEFFAAKPPDWIHWIPPAWLADLVAGFNRSPGFAEIRGVVIAAAAAVGLTALALLRLSAIYAALHTQTSGFRRSTLPAPPIQGTIATPLSLSLTHSRQEAVAFWLVRTMLKRDADLRLRVWPNLGLALATVALGLLTNQAGDPLVMQGAHTVLPVAFIPLAAAAVPGIVYALSFSRDHGATWLFAVAPMDDPGAMQAGLRKAVHVSIFAPFLVLCFVALAIAWQSPLHAFIHVLMAWFVIDAALIVSARIVLPSMPFSRPIARGAMSGSIALVSALVMGASSVVAVSYYFASGSIRGLGALGCGVIVARLVVGQIMAPASRGRET